MLQLTTLLHRAGPRRIPPVLTGCTQRSPHELGVLTAAARQRDGRSCGSAVLTVLLALGDPALRTWIVDGTGPRGPVPEVLRFAPADRLAALGAASVAERVAALQRVLTRRLTARAIGGLPWPVGLGAPPWTLAHAASHPGVRYRHLPVDDTDRGHLAQVLDRVEVAAECAVPVPLYTGGDLRSGPAAAVPRHVILVIGWSEAGLHVWEPSAGRTFVVARTVLAAGQPHRALGGWPHLTWAVLPVRWHGSVRHATMGVSLTGGSDEVTR